MKVGNRWYKANLSLGLCNDFSCRCEYTGKMNAFLPKYIYETKTAFKINWRRIDCVSCNDVRLYQDRIDRL